MTSVLVLNTPSTKRGLSEADEPALKRLHTRLTPLVTRALIGPRCVFGDALLKGSPATPARAPPPPLEARRCRVCARSAAAALCATCDGAACQECSRRCEACNQGMCTFCTTVDYEGRFERTICFECVGQGTQPHDRGPGAPMDL